jgi:hypothetical protein
MMDSVLDLASNIASKSPVAVQGTKVSLVKIYDLSSQKAKPDKSVLKR